MSDMICDCKQHSEEPDYRTSVEGEVAVQEKQTVELLNIQAVVPFVPIIYWVCGEDFISHKEQVDVQNKCSVK